MATERKIWGLLKQVSFSPRRPAIPAEMVKAESKAAFERTVATELPARLALEVETPSSLVARLAADRGVDEVGRGSSAGPPPTAAARLPRSRQTQRVLAA
jgi:hypothetical protein